MAFYIRRYEAPPRAPLDGHYLPGSTHTDPNLSLPPLEVNLPRTILELHGNVLTVINRLVRDLLEIIPRKHVGGNHAHLRPREAVHCISTISTLAFASGETYLIPMQECLPAENG